jgi:hypothetical protein
MQYVGSERKYHPRTMTMDQLRDMDRSIGGIRAAAGEVSGLGAALEVWCQDLSGDVGWVIGKRVRGMLFKEWLASSRFETMRGRVWLAFEGGDPDPVMDHAFGRRQKIWWRENLTLQGVTMPMADYAVARAILMTNFANEQEELTASRRRAGFTARLRSEFMTTDDEVDWVAVEQAVWRRVFKITRDMAPPGHPLHLEWVLRVMDCVSEHSFSMCIELNELI